MTYPVDDWALQPVRLVQIFEKSDAINPTFEMI